MAADAQGLTSDFVAGRLTAPHFFGAMMASGSSSGVVAATAAAASWQHSSQHSSRHHPKPFTLTDTSRMYMPPAYSYVYIYWVSSLQGRRSSQQKTFFSILTAASREAVCKPRVFYITKRVVVYWTNHMRKELLKSGPIECKSSGYNVHSYMACRFLCSLQEEFGEKRLFTALPEILKILPEVSRDVCVGRLTVAILGLLKACCGSGTRWKDFVYRLRF